MSRDPSLALPWRERLSSDLPTAGAMSRRQGVSLIESLVTLVIVGAILCPLVSIMMTSRRAQVKSRRLVVAGRLISYLAQEAIAHVPGSARPMNWTPADEVGSLANWAQTIADPEHVKDSWKGLWIARIPRSVGSERVLELRATWCEGSRWGQVTLGVVIR